MTPEIRDVEEQTVVCITRRGYGGTDFSEAAQSAFAALSQYLRDQNLMGEFVKLVGICPDDPSQVKHSEARYQAGAILKVPHEPEGEATIERIPAGRYAVFVHQGPYDTIGPAWRTIYQEWLPSSEHKLRLGASFEVYLNDPSDTAPEDLLTEIYVPLL